MVKKSELLGRVNEGTGHTKGKDSGGGRGIVASSIPLKKIKTCRRIDWWALERALDELEEKLKKTK